MATAKRKPHKTLIVRLDPELALALREQAQRERRTLQTVTTYALERYLARLEEKELVTHAER